MAENYPQSSVESSWSQLSTQRTAYSRHIKPPKTHVKILAGDSTQQFESL